MRFFLHQTSSGCTTKNALLLSKPALGKSAPTASAERNDLVWARVKPMLTSCLALLIGTLMSLSAFAQTTIKGTVTDEKNATLPGVTVTVKGTKTGTVTDINGTYSINAASGQTLVFSMVGFGRREVVINGTGPVSVTLTSTSSSLNEVVVVGYGTQRRTALTSSVSTITGAEITTTKNENIVNSLAGKVPGLRVVQNTSEPGAFNTTFDIRGMGTPLIVIDGIPRPDIARIDPNDVESLSVMKDASAAVYGARAANGVILITTKKGKKGPVEINYTGFYGLQVPASFPKSANALEYLELANEQSRHFVNGGLGGSFAFSDAFIEDFRNGTKTSTDWQAATIKRQSNETQHSLSASGGTDNSNYFLSLGYTGQDSYLKSDDLYYKKYNFRSNITSKVSKNLQFDLNLSGTMERKDQPMQAAYWVFRSMWYQPPINPVYANNNPMYLYSLPNPLHPVGQSTSDIGGFQIFNNKWFQSSAALTYSVPYVKGLSAKALYSFDMVLNNNKIFSKAYNRYTYNSTTNTYVVAGIEQNPSTIRREYYEYPTNLMQVSLNYNRSFANAHNVSALLLYEYSNRQGDNFFAQRELAIPLDQLYAGNSFNQQGNSSSSQNTNYNYRNAAYVGYATYDFKSKYLAKFAFRYDGSSRFPSSHQYGFFPDYELGWRISEEPFFKNTKALSFLNNFKLRGSYGITGDDGSLTYQFLTGYRYPASGSATGQPGGSVFNGIYTTAVQSLGIANPNIFWYKSKTLDVGFDFEAWNGLLGGSLAYFKRDRIGILANRQVTIPDVVGANFPQENLNSDRNQGFDFEVTHRYHINKFNYNLRGTFGFTRIMNRYIERAPSGNSYDNWLKNNTNRYKDVYFGYGDAGRFQSYQDIANSPIFVKYNSDRGTVPGDYIYEDYNGDGQISVDDSQPIANTGLPLMTFGLTAAAEYKGFDLNMVFNGAAMVNASYIEQLREPLWAGGNALVQFLDRWHPADPKANPYDPNTVWVPGYYAYTGTQPFQNTLHNTKNASYIRMKSAELGYNMPSRWFNKAGIKGIRVFFTGYNLLTITGLKYLDPEHPSSLSVVDSQFGYAYPIDKKYMFGLNLKL